MLQYKGRTMTQSVNRRLLTTNARIRSQVSPCGIYGGQSGARTGFYPGIKVVPCQCHCTNASYSAWSTRLSYQRDKWAKPGTFQKAVLFRKFGSIAYKSSL